jgi:adenine phosphoribosyltransferase
LFRDITPLLKHPDAFRECVDRFASFSESQSIDTIVAIDARGFLFASPVAYNLGKPLVPVRKEGKLPFSTHTIRYELEYGQDAVQVHTDAISHGQNVLIVDDLLATGGTMAAAVKLVEQTGGNVAGLAVVIELANLKGREILKGYDILSLVTY